MKIEITGFNAFGAIETEEHDAEQEETPIVTGLMPLSIVIKSKGIVTPIRFDYEDEPEEPKS